MVGGGRCLRWGRIMAQFLLELFSEEIPARMQVKAVDDLSRLITQGLAEAEVTFSAPSTYVTPRRLVIVIDGLPTVQADRMVERKGPRIDAPAAAIEGFLRSAETTIDACEKRDIKGATFLFSVKTVKGQDTAKLLGELIIKAIREFPWPKSMKFGGQTQGWVRPLHGIVALLDNKIIPGTIDMGGGKTLAFGNATKGHRFLSSGDVIVNDFAEYERKLRDAYVVLNRAEKKELILKGAAKALPSGLRVQEDKNLLEEVAGLVEWPVPLVGKIDAEFMKLPPEVLTAFMRSKQKYFSVETTTGSLAPHFVVVANMMATDGGKAIVAGNERVLRARLSDAQFFYETDQKQKLDLFLPKLADMTFHAKLGTVLDKVKRLEMLAATLAAYVPGADAKIAGRAAHLAKADLVTGMVGEFPELQGIMGRYYALHQGEDASVATAIAEHYAPMGPSDRCPSAANSVVVSLADKLDTLVGFFAIGEMPTGSKDPFALRRAALGLIRLIRENKLRLPLRKIFAAAGAGYGQRITWSVKIEDALLEFVADRLKVALKEQGVRHDLITAVFALGNEDDITRLLARVEALGSLLATEDGVNLLAAYRRATNILRIEEKKDGRTYASDTKKDLLSLMEESALQSALEKASAGVKTALPKEDYNSGMAALAGLRRPVDVFFDKVTVNAPEAALRENRLRLLAGIRDTMEIVADFSKIEG